MKTIRKIIILICSFVIGFTIGATLTNEYKKQENNEKTEKVEVVFEEPKEKSEEYINVWVNATVLNIRNEFNVDSKIVGKYYFGEQIIVSYINDYWAKEKNTGHYINRKFISEAPICYTNYDVPSNNSIKSYMSYRTITSTSSNQYKLQQIAYTGNNGIRMVNGRYCIAVGSYYTTTIGQYIDVVLENGSVIHGILADCKADEHTDSTNRIHKEDGSVVEFVVDTDCLDKTARKMGDISYISDWNSKVVNIKVYDKIESF